MNLSSRRKKKEKKSKRKRMMPRESKWLKRRKSVMKES